MGSVEHFNITLGNMICTVTPDTKVNWLRRLQMLTFLYNCTVHEKMGYAPFYLMFGQTPRLDLKDAMLIAQEHAMKEQCQHTEFNNRRAKGPAIAVGDRVLVANKKERGKR